MQRKKTLTGSGTRKEETGEDVEPGDGGIDDDEGLFFFFVFFCFFLVLDAFIHRGRERKCGQTENGEDVQPRVACPHRCTAGAARGYLCNTNQCLLIVVYSHAAPE